MNNLPLDGQECIDSVDVQQRGDANIGRNRQLIVPRLNFTCNGRINSIRARVNYDETKNSYPCFQVWRATSADSTIYNKTGEVQLSDDQVTRSGGFLIANIMLSSNDAIEFQLGDVVGYYHPSSSRYLVRHILTDGYVLYRFNGPPAADNSEDISQPSGMATNRQPLLQFDIGM